MNKMYSGAVATSCQPAMAGMLRSLIRDRGEKTLQPLAAFYKKLCPLVACNIASFYDDTREDFVDCFCGRSPCVADFFGLHVYRMSPIVTCEWCGVGMHFTATFIANLRMMLQRRGYHWYYQYLCTDTLAVVMDEDDM